MHSESASLFLLQLHEAKVDGRNASTVGGHPSKTVNLHSLLADVHYRLVRQLAFVVVACFLFLSLFDGGGGGG